MVIVSVFALVRANASCGATSASQPLDVACVLPPATNADLRAISSRGSLKASGGSRVTTRVCEADMISVARRASRCLAKEYDSSVPPMKYASWWAASGATTASACSTSCFARSYLERSVLGTRRTRKVSSSERRYSGADGNAISISVSLTRWTRSNRLFRPSLMMALKPVAPPVRANMPPSSASVDPVGTSCRVSGSRRYWPISSAKESS